MTASKPETRPGDIGAIGFQTFSFAAREAFRTRCVTSYPCDPRNGTNAEPIKPEAPLMRTRSTDTLYRGRGRPRHIFRNSRHLSDRSVRPTPFLTHTVFCSPIACADIIRNKETGHRILLSGLAGQSLPWAAVEGTVRPTLVPAMTTIREQFATNVLTVTKFRELLRDMRENRPNDDLELVRKAYEFSQKTHAGQHRASGEPYLVHPLEVALVLAEMKMDGVAVAAGLLHDSVEDTSVTIVDIRKEFGEQVAHIVEGVTKISQIDFSSREEQQAENLRKMMLAMVDDIRVVLIKLADRLHNMRTLEHLPEERQQKIARETLDIYAPIAHRLGMGKIRGELEDLGFRYLDPIGYQQVHEAVESRRKKGEQFLGSVEDVLRDKLKEAGITATVESRIKRVYSIHKKLVKQRISVDQVYDLYAMRVITRSVQDCYAVLGIVHNLWRPVPGRIKDFIAMPRPNLYQSLHTSVITEEGTSFEIQIRTEEMHRMAEEGIAAHWKYKDGAVSAKDEQRLAWLRQVVEWQRDVSDPSEFLSTL